MKSRSQLHHAGNVVDGQAVDQKGVDAHLFEAARSPAEEIALRWAPVLAVDTADAVAAASKRDPDGQPELEEVFDERERLGLADEREGLEQDHVGLLVVEDLREEPRGAAPRERLCVLRQREGDARVGSMPRPPPSAQAGSPCGRCPSSAEGRHGPSHRPVPRRARTTCSSRSRRSRPRRTSGGRRRPPRERDRAPSSPRDRPSPRDSSGAARAGAPWPCLRRGRRTLRLRASAGSRSTVGRRSSRVPSVRGRIPRRRSLSG